MRECVQTSATNVQRGGESLRSTTSDRDGETASSGEEMDENETFKNVKRKHLVDARGKEKKAKLAKGKRQKLKLKFSEGRDELKDLVRSDSDAGATDVEELMKSPTKPRELQSDKTLDPTSSK